ncbi:MAG TPA: sugar transferase, partial [Streptosporangiaceae bacterium]|nr:sugar transferase [Streptosporangiaceae bacterium]
MSSDSAVSKSWAVGEGSAGALSYGRVWTAGYIRRAVLLDGVCALLAGLLAYAVRFDDLNPAMLYLLISTVLLPVGWLAVVAMLDGYDARFIGLGSDEFRRILNAGLLITAGVAITSYAAKADLARGYVLVAFPTLTILDLVSRYALRRNLHRRRMLGECMQKVVAVGYPDVVADLTAQLRRDAYHGLSVVAACVAGPDPEIEVGGITAVHGLDNIVAVVDAFGADTVAVLSCPEMSGTRLRELAWELEKSGTSLCVAPTLLDVAGPRTSIRSAAGLPLMYMDHPEFTGVPRLLKTAFDRAVALAVLLVLSPLMAGIALAIK